MAFQLHFRSSYLSVHPAFPFDGKWKCLIRSDPKTIAKVGEGTYGEAFEAGKAVCKIVPIDGDLRVNGEVQKVFIWAPWFAVSTLASSRTSK